MSVQVPLKGSISEFRRCDLTPIHDHMEPHGSAEVGGVGGGWGGEWEIRPARQLVSQLMVVSPGFAGTCPSSAASPQRCRHSARDS